MTHLFHTWFEQYLPTIRYVLMIANSHNFPPCVIKKQKQQKQNLFF